jgi:hypothetical protein
VGAALSWGLRVEPSVSLKRARIFHIPFRYGVPTDVAGVRSILTKALSQKSSPGVLDAAFALTTGASNASACVNGVNAVVSARSLSVVGTADVVTFLGDVMASSLLCRPAALSVLPTMAQALWAEQKAGGTATVLGALTTLSTSADLAVVTKLLSVDGGAVVTPRETNAALTLIQINIEMVAANIE